MKRIVLLILVLILMLDMAEDGYLGNGRVYLPNPSAKTTLTSSHDCPGSGHTDFLYELRSADLSGSPRHGNAQPVTPNVAPTLQIIDCCHLNSSGGIPL